MLRLSPRQSMEVETRMTAVERVLEYCALDQEPPAQVSPTHTPPPNWPSRGHLRCSNACMSHSKDPQASLAYLVEHRARRQDRHRRKDVDGLGLIQSSR